MNKVFSKKHNNCLKALRITLMSIIIIIYGYNTFSQTFINSNLYFINKYQLNPAYTGEEQSLYALLNYRTTSSISQGAPVSINLAVHSPLFKNIGAGIRLSNNKEGLFNNTTVFTDFKYKVAFKASQNLSFGLSAGLESNKMDYSKIIAEDQAAIIDVASKNYVGASFQTSAGIAYNWKNFDIGLSIPQLFENKNNIGLSYSALSSYNYQITDYEIDLKPSILLIKNPNTKILSDYNLQATYKKQFWLGISYKNRPSFVFSTGINMFNFRFAYAIEFGTEKHSNIFNKIHEISVAYNINKIEKTPNDSLFIQNTNLYLIPDTLASKTDSTSLNEQITNQKNKDVDSTTIIISIKEKNNKVDHKNKKSIELKETGDGVFIIHNSVSDTSEIKDLEIDSLTLKSILVDISNTDSLNKNNNKIKNGKSDNDTLKFIEVGNGIYRIQNKKTGKFIEIKNDSISNKIIDSLAIKFMSTKKMRNPDDKTIKKYNYYHEVYYSIRVFINNSTQYLLNKPELSEKIRVQTNKKGDIKYYYGKYSNIEAANQQLKYLKKIGVTNIKIEKISSFQ